MGNILKTITITCVALFLLSSCSSDALSERYITMDCSVDDVSYAAGLELNRREDGDGLLKFTGGKVYSLFNRKIVANGETDVYVYDTNVENIKFRMVQGRFGSRSFAGSTYEYNDAGIPTQGPFLMCFRTDWN